MKTNIKFGWVAIGLLVCLLASACGPAAAPVISIENAWGKPSMDMPTAGGLFMVVKNTGNAADRLIAGNSSACGSLEVHDMVKKADGTMGMNLVDKPVEIAANGQVDFKSGALHIMCIAKNDQFKPGAKIDINLNFVKSGIKTFQAEIRSQ